MKIIGNKTFAILACIVFAIVAIVNYTVGTKLMPIGGYVATYIVLACAVIYYVTKPKQ